MEQPMDQLFPTEFSQGEEGVTHHDSESAPQPVHDSPQLEHPLPNATTASLPPGSGTGTPEQDIPLRGKAATHGLTAEEKRERQKQQNRRAAERSRNKKREEVTALEMTVNNIQEENNRLRARLATLMASKPDAGQAGENGDAAANASPSVDISTLAQLQQELAAAKSTLLEREIELSRLGNSQSHTITDETRRTLVSRTAALKEAEAEVKALNTVINELRTEHELLNRRRDVVARELDLRRSLQGSPGDATALSTTRASGVERTLLELRGLVDGVIKTWEQSSMIPSRPEDPASRGLDVPNNGR